MMYLSDEHGSALVIALIFIGIWAVAIVAVLGNAETGFKLASGVAEQRGVTYSVDAAGEAVIADTKGYLEDGGDPDACPPLFYVEQAALSDDIDSTLEEMLGEVTCEDVEFTPAWFPYESWSEQSDSGIEWLDDPADDAPAGPEGDLVGGYPYQFDPGADVLVLVDSDVGRYGDVDGNSSYDQGEPLEEPQFDTGAITVTVSVCGFPGYGDWQRLTDGTIDWVDASGDDPESPWAFDGGDLRILVDGITFVDVDGSTDFNTGDVARACDTELVARAVLDADPGEPDVVVEQWRVFR